MNSSKALLGIPDLPEEAFKHVGNRKIKPQGDSGGGQSAAPTTQTTTAELPEWARPYAKNILAKGSALTDINQNPYQQYGGNRIAGFSPMQMQSYQNAANMDAGPQGFQEQVGQYMSPYMQNVVDVQKRGAIRDYQVGNTMQQAQATQAGAFGGGREAIQRAERERGLMGTLGNIQAQGSQAAYDQAANQFRQGIQQNLGINQLQNQYGGQMQQQAQRPLDMAYQDFLNQQNYPYKQLGFMSDLVRGMPLGQKSTSSVYDQGPGMVQTLAGLGGAAYGFGKSGLFGKEGGLMTSHAGGGQIEDEEPVIRYADGGGVKTYAGDRGSVTSQDNKNAIVEDMYSMTGLQKAREAALNRRDLDTVQAIDERLRELSAIKQAETASINYGLGGAFNQIPQDQQEQMMAGGGIVAFAPGGVTYKKQSEDALTGLNDLVNRYPAPQTAEEYEGAVTKRLPMVEKLYGPDITKPYLEETKAKREKLSEQLEKDTGLAFAMSSLGMLARKRTPGESQKNQLISGLGEAGQQFAGEVGRLRKDSREADDKLRQSEITLATAQQARKEGLVGKAMGLEDRARAEALDGYKTHLSVAKDVAQMKSGLAGHEMSAEASKYAADQGLKGHLASAAASLKGHQLTAGKPSALKEGTDVYYAKLRPMYPDKSDEDVRAMAQQKYLEQTKTGMPGVEAKIAATAEEKARERAAGRMDTDPVALKAAREKDASALSARRREILREELARPPEQVSAEAPAAQTTPNAPAQQPAAVNIPPQAVNMLKQNPTADNRRYFDQTFGAGAAARVLGQ
jgi:hypothetical protein